MQLVSGDPESVLDPLPAPVPDVAPEVRRLKRMSQWLPADHAGCGEEDMSLVALVFDDQFSGRSSVAAVMRNRGPLL